MVLDSSSRNHRADVAVGISRGQRLRRKHGECPIGPTVYRTVRAVFDRVRVSNTAGWHRSYCSVLRPSGMPG